MANIAARVSGNWHTGSNWVGGVVPTATDVAILNGKIMTLAQGASITCSSIEGGTALESLVNAIKAKTDQLDFTTVSVNTGTSVDAEWNNVILLTRFDGEAGSATFVDDSANTTMTAIGGASLSATHVKHGSTAVALDGINDGVVCALPVSLVGRTNFTAECWFYLSGYSGSTQIIMGNWEGSAGLSWNMCLVGTSAKLYSELTTSGAYSTSVTLGNSSTPTVSIGVWHHAALTKQGNTFRLFLDGVLTDTLTQPAALYTDSNTVRVGCTLTNGSWFNGYIDELRLTKDVARYTTNFTPSAVPFPGEFSVVTATHVRSVTLADDITEAIKTKTDQLTLSTQQIKNLVVAGLN